ncbi:hypothetical protein C7B61_18960 [filamentous cyanobacterium CCP1]|nr:hypothetical protein C7B76_14875 [filamentous cyanobacterium CCP2]PSB59199.1 hypothetical protein C7B61_18960 [filamentous cyanobacterium CCP1]
MSKPNFDRMSREDLHAYVLAHRDDQEAFYAYINKLHVEAEWVEMPALQSLEDLENYSEFVEHVRRRSEPQDKAY